MLPKFTSIILKWPQYINSYHLYDGEGETSLSCSVLSSSLMWRQERGLPHWNLLKMNDHTRHHGLQLLSFHSKMMEQTIKNDSFRTACIGICVLSSLNIHFILSNRAKRDYFFKPIYFYCFYFVTCNDVWYFSCVGFQHPLICSTMLLLV